MKTKEEIVNNWLPRYTDTPLKDFGKYILLVNFEEYLHMFSAWYNAPIRGAEKPMANVTAEGITLINFGMAARTRPRCSFTATRNPWSRSPPRVPRPERPQGIPAGSG